MSAFIFVLGITLMHFLWQGLLIGGATALLLAVLRNSRAEYRYLVACSALLACLVWPALGLYGRLAGDAAAIGAAGSAVQFAAHAIIGTGQPFDLRASVHAIVSAWALCAAVLSLRIVLGLLWIRHTAASTAALQHPQHAHWQSRLAQMAERFGISRSVRLRIVTALASPVTAGWWRPVVLVPAALVAGMPPPLLEALLAHELAHVRRHDYLINLLQNVIETLLFYHPAVWWLSNRIRAERELIADDFAARQLGEPRRLALALSELERLQFSTHQLALAANGGNLMERIKHLMKNAHPERTARQGLNWKAAVPMLGLALACLSIYAEATATDQHAAKDSRAVVDFSTCNKPVWPQSALSEQRTGRVTLKFLVSDNGKVTESGVVKSSGHTDLDEAARTGIEQCTFKPAIKKGKPAQSWVQVQYVWTLS